MEGEVVPVVREALFIPFGLCQVVFAVGARLLWPPLVKPLMPSRA